MLLVGNCCVGSLCLAPRKSYESFVCVALFGYAAPILLVAIVGVVAKIVFVCSGPRVGITQGLFHNSVLVAIGAGGNFIKGSGPTIALIQHTRSGYVRVLDVLPFFSLLSLYLPLKLYGYRTRSARRSFPILRNRNARKGNLHDRLLVSQRILRHGRTNTVRILHGRIRERGIGIIV